MLSEANPDKADNPSLLPIVGSSVRPIDKIEDNSEPPTCFLMLVLVSLISMPFFNCLFLFNRLKTFACINKVSEPVQVLLDNLKTMISLL